MKKTRLVALAAGLALAAALSPAKAKAADFNITLGGVSNSIEWTAQVDPSSATAPVTYFLLYRDGLNYSYNQVLSANTTIYAGPSNARGYSGHMRGSFCVVARASSPVSGIFNESPVACHSWLHKDSGGNTEGVTRTDGSGTQLGMNQQWYFKYYLDEDSLVTLKIYPPGTGLTTHASGFTVVNGSPAPTKVVVSSTPRSGELDSGVSNTEMWDSRNTAGQVVPNGLYIGQLEISSPLSAYAYNYIGVFTVPVDVIRFTAFTTEGISPSQSMAKVNYTITGDATVRIVVAKPGRLFTFDANGDVYPLCPAATPAGGGCIAGTIDITTFSVVQTLTYNKRAGSYSEGWNGTDWSGAAVSSGIYSVGISARDGYGNQALNLSGGNDGPIQGTIPVERTAGQSAIDTTPPSVTAISVGGTAIDLNGGTNVNTGFTSIVFTLNKSGGTGGNSSIVTLTSPTASAAITDGLVTTSGNQVTYSSTTVMNSTGVYTITIIAKDTLGNMSSVNSYSFVGSTDAVAPQVGYIQVSGSSISLAGGATVSPGFTTVVVGLSKQSGTGVFVSTVTMTGPSGAIAGAFSISSNTLTFTASAAQNTEGTYSVTVQARDYVGNRNNPAPYTFTVTATGGTTSTVQTEAAFKASLKVYPNPVRTAPLNIEFTLLAQAVVDIDLYNLLGERCYHHTGTYAAGVQTLTWNLANDSAKTVGNGVFLLRITSREGGQTFKVMKKVMVLR